MSSVGFWETHKPYSISYFSSHTAELSRLPLALPIAEGKLLLGAWQSILLLELDGPRRRKLVCTVFESQD